MAYRSDNIISGALTKLIGERDKFTMEHRFLTSVALGAILLSLFSTAANIMLSLGIEIILVTLIGFFVYFVFYFRLRYYNTYERDKWLLTLFTFLEFSFLYILNAGSHGPTLYLYCVVFSFLVLLFKNKTRVILILIMGLNILALFIIELKNPMFLTYYHTSEDRYVDIYIGLIMYFVMGFLIVNYIQQNYKREKARAENSDYLKSAFLANMSHEIRTPMNSIIGFSKMLERTNLPDEKKTEYIRIINENGKYLLTLIEDLIEISKLESNQIKLLRIDVNLNDLFNKLRGKALEFLNLKNKEHIKLSMDIPQKEIVLKTDYERIYQVMFNLISNAIKYTNKGEICFGFKCETDSIVCFVNDTGIGVKEKYLGEIFDRFRKLNDENGEQIFRGTGIGLSISKKIIELMGGTIWVKSEYMKGSSFNFKIPIP